MKTTFIPSHAPVIVQMEQYIQRWQETADGKALFLRCYMMMTSNMLLAVEQEEFNDPVWVNRLLHRFADYYYIGLEAYEQQPDASPLVWQQAHQAAHNPRISAVQKMLLGVNAHINYDLVLTLVDLLQDEWAGHSPDHRARRYADHCHVNDVIGRTIDAVQDDVLQPAMPIMGLIDRLMGRLDERLLSRLITRWREQVWQDAIRLLEAEDQAVRAELLQQIATTAVATGRLISGRG